jgi:hypothetical protein
MPKRLVVVAIGRTFLENVQSVVVTDEVITLVVLQ